VRELLLVSLSVLAVVVVAVVFVFAGSSLLPPEASSLNDLLEFTPAASAGAVAVATIASAHRAASAAASHLPPAVPPRFTVRREYRRTGGPGRARRSTPVEWPPMPPKQRQIRIEQRGAMQAIQALEQRSDEELEAETKYKAAAMAILGARASERFDAEAARSYFQRAIAAARPQERMQIRRMADASLALAERRAGDLKDAVERLGQAPPSGRQLLALRAMGLLVPPSSAGIIARIRGILLILALIIVLLGIGTGIVELVSLPFGGLEIAPSILLGLFVVVAALGVAAAIGRRRRDRAKASAGP
jgi:hypothetical protein